MDKSCSNCNNCTKIYKHPSNEAIGKGSILKVMGYICMFMDGELHPIFMETDLNMCEEWEAREIKEM